jgi:hypothetical protein
MGYKNKEQSGHRRMNGGKRRQGITALDTRMRSIGRRVQETLGIMGIQGMTSLNERRGMTSI